MCRAGRRHRRLREPRRRQPRSLSALRRRLPRGVLRVLRACAAAGRRAHRLAARAPRRPHPRRRVHLHGAAAGRADRDPVQECSLPESSTAAADVDLHLVSHYDGPEFDDALLSRLRPGVLAASAAAPLPCRALEGSRAAVRCRSGRSCARRRSPGPSGSLLRRCGLRDPCAATCGRLGLHAACRRRCPGASPTSADTVDPKVPATLPASPAPSPRTWSSFFFERISEFPF